MTNQQLIQNAGDDGLSQNSVGILINNLTPVTIAGAQGIDVNDLAGDEVTLFVRVIDATGSMGSFKSEVISAANEQVDALLGSKAADEILMSTFLFNTRSTLVHSYLPLSSAVRLDTNNYQPDQTTALYDATLDAITSAVSYAQSLRDSGIRVKVVIVIISDGEDNASKHSAAHVNTVVSDLLRQEYYTVAFVAFGMNGGSVAPRMGVPTENVLNARADAHDVRLAMGTVSKSVIRASQSLIGPGQSFFS